MVVLLQQCTGLHCSNKLSVEVDKTSSASPSLSLVSQPLFIMANHTHSLTSFNPWHTYPLHTGTVKLIITLGLAKPQIPLHLHSVDSFKPPSVTLGRWANLKQTSPNTYRKVPLPTNFTSHNQKLTYAYFMCMCVCLR